MLAARTAAGADCVLKLPFPSPEVVGESAALVLWDGRGAVRLLEDHPGSGALVLERCRPGTDLGAVPAATAEGVLCELLPQLWRPEPGGFTAAADEARHWVAGLEASWEAGGRVVPARALPVVTALAAELAATPGPPVLVHQDLHAGNVLRSARGWLAIDPKPLSAERELGLAPVVRSHELGARRSDVLGRLDRLPAALGLDRDRVLAWTLLQTVAWSVDGTGPPEHRRVVGWLLDEFG